MSAKPSSRISAPPANAQDLLTKFTDFAFNAAKTAGKITHKGVNMAEGIVSSGIDAVGLKDKVENMENMARKLAAKGKSDANKAVNRARRMANRALVFEEEDDSMASHEYDVLLSAAGAVDKKIAGYMNHTASFSVPAGCRMVWKARVKKHDIGFTVKEVRGGEAGNNVSIIVEPSHRYMAETLIQGELSAENRPRTITLTFDNSHAALQRKTVVYLVQIGEKVSLSEDHGSVQRTMEFAAAEEGPPDYAYGSH